MQPIRLAHSDAPPGAGHGTNVAPAAAEGGASELARHLADLWAAIAQFFALDTGRLLEPDIVARLVAQVLLLLCSAFFSGSETAMFSLSRLDLQKLRRDRHPQSETIHALLDRPRSLIISILCGNELVNIVAIANLTGILVALYGTERAGIISLLVMVPLLLLFGEVTPKTLAVSNPVRGVGVVASPLNLWVRLVSPLRFLIRVVADRVTTWIVGSERDLDNILQKEEFRTVLEEVAEEGHLDATERVLIDNLLEAAETEIVEIMTPRTRIDFLNVDTPVPELVEAFRKFGHPRVPVYEGHRDNLVGFIHAEDVLTLTLEGVDLKLLVVSDLMHPPVVVPPTKLVQEMFEFFQKNRVRAAVVLNEFGGVDGFITMRDVINFVFGEISEGIRGQDLYRELDQDTYEVPGDMKLTDFNDLTNLGLSDPRMTTIGGVVFRYLDRLPKVGDLVEVEGLQATVLEMDGHRLARVRIAKQQEAHESVLPTPNVELDEDDAEDEDEVPPSSSTRKADRERRAG